MYVFPLDSEVSVEKSRANQHPCASRRVRRNKKPGKPLIELASFEHLNTGVIASVTGAPAILAPVQYSIVYKESVIFAAQILTTRTEAIQANQTHCLIAEQRG